MSLRMVVKSCVKDIAWYLKYLQKYSDPRLRALYLYLVENKSPKEIERELGIHRGTLRGMVERIFEKCPSPYLATLIATKLLIKLFDGDKHEVQG